MAVACKFKVQIFKKSGLIRYEGPWFSNTILDSGLDFLMTSTNSRIFGPLNGILRTCNIGSGNSLPSTEDTGLESYFTYSQNQDRSGSADHEAGFREWIGVFEFGVGTFSDTEIREVGLSLSGNSTYFNRQLFRDENGDPVTLTLQSDEGLRVTAAVTKYAPVPIGDMIPGSIDFNGTTHTTQTEAMDGLLLYHSNVHNTYQFFEIGKEGETNGTRYNASAEDYVPGSFERYYNRTIDASSFEGYLGWIATRVNTWGGHEQVFKIHFDEPVGPITDTEEIKIRVKRSIGRYEE